LDLGDGKSETSPCLKFPSPLPVNDDPQVPTNSGGLRILVVDDNRDSADSIAMFLKVSGPKSCCSTSACPF